MPDFPYGKDYPEEDFFDQDGIVPSSWSADRYGVDGAEAELDRRPEDDDDLSEECSGQLRMAHRLAVGYRDRLMYVEGIGWHHWDGKRWAFDDGGYAKRAVIYILEQAIAETIGATKDSPARSAAPRCPQMRIGVRGDRHPRAGRSTRTVRHHCARPRPRPVSAQLRQRHAGPADDAT